MSYRTWSLIPMATWPTLTCRRSRILRHSPCMSSIQMSTPEMPEQRKTVMTGVNPHVTWWHSSAVLPSRLSEEGWLAEAVHSTCPSVWLLQEEKTPELRSSDEWSESFTEETALVRGKYLHIHSLHTSASMIHTWSEASISEQLKQDGGSSRGSGDGVWMMVPTATSRVRQQNKPIQKHQNTNGY